MSRFILICTTHRTGSNLLSQQLKTSKIGGRPVEYFSPIQARKVAGLYHLPNPDTQFTQYVQDLIPNRLGENGVFSAKIMWPHLASMKERLLADPNGSHIAQQLSETDPAGILLHFFPKPQIIWLTRQDKIMQAISMVKAQQTNLFSSQQIDRNKPHINTKIKPEYDFKAIHYYVGKFTRDDAKWKQFFQKHQLHTIEVAYEALAEAPREVTTATLKQLGFLDPIDWAGVEVPIRKLSDHVNQQWKQRYLEDVKLWEQEELAAALNRKAQKRQRRWNAWSKNWLGRCAACVEMWLRREGNVSQGSEDNRSSLATNNDK